MVTTCRSSDTLIVTEIARRAEQIVGDDAVFLTALWIGASHRHLAFPRMISIADGQCVSVLDDLAESLIAGGFRRILFLNSSGGKIVLAEQALHNVQLRHHDERGLYLVYSSWWDLAAGRMAGMDAIRSEQVTHACAARSIRSHAPPLPALRFRSR